MGMAGAGAAGAGAATSGLIAPMAGASGLGIGAASGGAVLPALAGGGFGPAATMGSALGTAGSVAGPWAQAGALGKGAMGALGTAAPIAALIQGPGAPPSAPAQINPRPQQYAGNKPGNQQQGGNDQVLALLRALLQGGQA
jgi:hypothetical protein